MSDSEDTNDKAVKSGQQDHLNFRRNPDQEEAAATAHGSSHIDSATNSVTSRSSPTIAMDDMRRDLSLNFGSSLNEDDELANQRKKALRDPLSHRIIEKRRRDRMNNCLADLSRLIPSCYLKKGRGRIEKTEIIEMATKHMKHLHTHTTCRSIEKCEPSPSQSVKKSLSEFKPEEPRPSTERNVESFRMGYRECLSEIMHFLVEKEGMYAGDPLCVRMMSHLQRRYEKLNKVKLFRQTESVGSTGTVSTLSEQPSTIISEHPSVISSISSSSGYGSLGHHTLPYQMRATSSYPAPTTESSETSSVRHMSSSVSESFESSSLALDMTGGAMNSRSSEDRKTEEADGRRERKISTNSYQSMETSFVQKEEFKIRSVSEERQQKDEHSKAEVDAEKACSDEGNGMYKFKANLRDRFSHQHPLSPRPSNTQRGSSSGHHQHQQRPYLNETASIASSNSSNMSDENDHSSMKRKKMKSEFTKKDERGKETRLATSRSCQQMKHQSGRSNSPQKMLSYVTSAEDQRQHQRNPHHIHHQRNPQIPVTSTTPLNLRGLSSDLSNSSLLGPAPQHQSGPNVPIFALHPKGSYYIPLSIDYTVIASSMLVLTSAEENNGGSVVLHPITINVNFCGPVQMSINPGVASELLGGRRATGPMTTSPSAHHGSSSLRSDSRHHHSNLETSRQENTPRWRERLDRIISPSRDDHHGFSNPNKCNPDQH